MLRELSMSSPSADTRFCRARCLPDSSVRPQLLLSSPRLASPTCRRFPGAELPTAARGAAPPSPAVARLPVVRRAAAPLRATEWRGVVKVEAILGYLGEMHLPKLLVRRAHAGIH